MNKAYRVVLNKATGAWTAVSEIACGRGKGRTAVQVAIAALIAGAGVFATSGAVAQTVSGGLQLCTVGGLGVGAGTSLGSGGLGVTGALGCAPNVAFGLNNAATALGAGGTGAPTASITGFSTGLLELRGNGGISLLGATTFNADAAFGGNKITGLGAGTADTDAANFGQVKAVQNSVTALTNGTAGLVIQDPATSIITIGESTGGDTIDITGREGRAQITRTLTGLTDGRVANNSTDAITGRQLFRTTSSIARAFGGGASVAADGTINAPSYDVGDVAPYNNVGDALGSLGTRVKTNTEKIGDLETKIGTIGANDLVQQDANTGAITVGKGVAGSEVSVAGTGGDRRLTGVANGTADNDAVNYGQLKALDANAVKYDANGNVDLARNGKPAQIKNVADGTEDGDAVNVSQLKRAGLVNPDGSVANVVTYDDDTRSKVTLGGADGTTLTNVAAGAVTANSMDAINGAQLYATNQTVATALGASLGADGSIVAPTFTVGGNTYTNVGDVFKNLDNRVFSLEQGGGNNTPVDPRFSGSGNGGNDKEDALASGTYATASGANAVASGNHATATGANAVASHDNSVALGAGSVTDRENSVSVGSAGNERVITNVMAGTQDTDAVNMKQFTTETAKIQQSVDTLQSQVNQRFDQLDNRVNRVGAMNAAMSAMVASAAGLQTDNRMAIGTGLYRGQTALAVGYQRKLGSRATVTIGGSTAGGSEYNVGLGAGYGW